MWWWAGLLGCVSASRVAALEQELAEAKAEVEALEKRVAALDAPEQDGRAERDARRTELQQRLADRRKERELALQGGSDPLGLPERPNLTVRQAFADPEYASRLGRAVLHMGPEGEHDGYRLSAIRRGSLIDRIGVKNGDIVHAVNGMPVRSMEEAMTAYEALSKPEVKELTLKLTRRGSPEELRVLLDELPPPLEIDASDTDEGAE